MADDPGTLATRLNALFATFHPAGQKPPSIEAVCQAINAKGGATISVGYLSELRRGQATNPRLDHLKALADYFGVDVAYFTDEERSAEIQSELRLLRAIRDQRIRALALRAGELDSASLDALAAVLEDLQRGWDPESGAGGQARP